MFEEEVGLFSSSITLVISIRPRERVILIIVGMHPSENMNRGYIIKTKSS